MYTLNHLEQFLMSNPHVEIKATFDGYSVIVAGCLIADELLSLEHALKIAQGVA